MLYKHKNYDYGFIILCPNGNIGHLRNTISSIELYYPSTPVLVILPESCELVSLNVNTLIGGKTIPSMINVGMKATSCKEWNFIIITNGWMRNHIDLKYSYFIENKQDIFYPILTKKINFIDSDINGMLIHKSTFNKVGPFPDMESIKDSKLIWANKAIEKGFKFKGIVGARVF